MGFINDVLSYPKMMKNIVTTSYYNDLLFWVSTSEVNHTFYIVFQLSY